MTSALSIQETTAKATVGPRVAVLGSGVAGATAARTLAERGCRVTVFEAGRGIGGRTSTRVTRDRNRYQFDHGGQYVSAPAKTEEFRRALERWKTDGWVEEWKGRFGTASVVNSENDDNDVVVVTNDDNNDNNKKRWVGVPGMHSVCRNLLHHERIRVKLQTRAEAVYNDQPPQPQVTAAGAVTPSPCWDLVHHKSAQKTKPVPLGSFDWLVVTDRNSGAHRRGDLTAAPTEIRDDWRTSVRSIRSVPSLAAGLVLDEPLVGVAWDGLQFDDANDNDLFGSLGWAARDSSKPGRLRTDGKECWVLQSRPDKAEELFESISSSSSSSSSSDLNELVREQAREMLVSDFFKVVSHLGNSNDGGNSKVHIPTVAYSVGHRWSAAFPIPSTEFAETESQLMLDQRFVACGDYFGKYAGRVEGAYLSGRSAANRLYDAVSLCK